LARLATPVVRSKAIACFSVPNGAQLEEDELEYKEELQSIDESKTHFETVVSI